MEAKPGEAPFGAHFSREQRLLHPEAFQQVFAEGCRTNLPGMVLLSRANGGVGPRLGLAISRKQARRSVDRSRIRRQIRESFRLHQHDLGNRDYVLLARSGLDQMASRTLRMELDRHWEVHIRRCAKSSSP